LRVPLLKATVMARSWRRPIRCAIFLFIGLALCGCGMGRAAQKTGELFDKYGCLSKELRGEKPCAQ